MEFLAENGADNTIFLIFVLFGSKYNIYVLHSHIGASQLF